MPDIFTGIMAGGSLLGSSMEADAAGDASAMQSASAQAGIDEQRRQFDAMRQLLQPYVDAGNQALGGLQPYAQIGAPALAQQKALAGLSGAGAQNSAISAIEASPLFQAQIRQGEQSLLSNASATGGLRGGNIQAALAQFRPQMLTSEIERQYNRLGGLSGLGNLNTQYLAQMGQSSAAGVGAQGSAMGANIANLLQQQGAAQAGGALGRASAYSNMIGGIAGGIGRGMGMGQQTPQYLSPNDPYGFASRGVDF